MLPNERRIKIIEILSQKEFVSVNELCEKLFASVSTIRRDLIRLEEENLIIRVRGGASLKKERNLEFTHSSRINTMVEEKQAVADAASTFIKDGATIFLDSSSTVSHLVPFLSDFKNITIITNSLNISLKLNHYKFIKTILIGGNLLHNSNSIVGSQAIEQLQKYYTDHFIFSCRGFNANGIFEANIEQAVIKEHMFRNSKNRILISDHSKINKNFFYKFINTNEVDTIIVDKKIDTMNNYRNLNNLIFLDKA